MHAISPIRESYAMLLKQRKANQNLGQTIDPLSIFSSDTFFKLMHIFELLFELNEITIHAARYLKDNASSLPKPFD